MFARARFRPLRWLVAGLVVAGLVPAGASAATRFTSTAKAGGVTLTVTGTVHRINEIPRYRNLVMTLRGGGRVLRKPLVGAAAESWSARPSAKLADVSGDGRVDAFVDTFSGGAHCCTVATITISTGKGRWAKPFRRAWDGGYRLRDLGTGDGTYEILAVDQRFDYLFAAHAMSARPITIEHAAAGGTFTDVSTQFPERLRADANEWLKAWEDLGPTPNEPADEAEARGFAARSVLATALADLLRLGALEEAKALSAKSVARGDFAHLPPADEKIFDTDVAHQLVKLGFLTDWTVLGLPQ
jgi:hypothetical protein